MTSTDERFSALEQKYIDLLERRVQDLERKLANGEVNGTIASNSKKTKEVKPKDKKEDESETETTDSKEKKDKETDSDTDDDNDNDDDNDTGTSPETKAEPDPQKRYRVVIREYDSNTGEYVDRANDNPVKPAKKPKESKGAFTFRKNRAVRAIGGIETFRSDGSEVVINSLALQKLLARVTSRLDAGKSKVTDMNSPFQDLIWCWKEAEAQAATSAELEDAFHTGFKGIADDEKQAKLDLRALLDTISTSSGDEALDAYFRSKDDMKESRTISFGALWTLFPPGSFIIGRPFLSQNQVFMVQDCSIPDATDSDAKLVVTVFGYDWNGTNFHRVPYRFSIDAFKDKKTISQLQFYPLKHYRKGDEISNESQDGLAKDGSNDVKEFKDQLIKRGKKFFKFCTAEKGKKTFGYDGRAFHTSTGGLFRPVSSPNLNDADSASVSGTTTYGSPDGGSVGVSSQIKGTVVVDFKSYFEYQPESAQRLGSLDRVSGSVVCSCGECRDRYRELYRYDWDKANRNSQLSDEQYMLLPPRVLGYSLEQKRWVHLDINRLKELAAADSSNFDNKLLLHPRYKTLIRNSVKAHGKENVVDYTPNKGKGLILLLWGVPGVGKTLTAESVAMLAGKPLLSIGVSDIGTDSSMVEANLQRVFALAGLWEAVLLFDEADVFLEDRSTQGSNIHGNTMVSVLLRILEYYEGILILTTNRVRTFDIAVQSRIHIAIEYKELEEEQCEKMFLDFLEQLKDKYIEDWKDVERWVKEYGRSMSFNGRQIRNTVYTAMGMAHAEDRKLRSGDLNTVAKTTEQFKKVLAEKEAIYRSDQITGRR